MTVAVIIPVLARPEQLAPLLEDLRASQSEVELQPLFVISASDQPELDAAVRAEASFLVADWQPGPGDFQRKIHLGYQSTTAPWIFQAADDVSFQPGWADHAVRLGEETGARVIGTQDDGNPNVKRGNHSTHTLIARDYCDDPGASMDGPGSVFSSAYSHQWTDTELVELAKVRGVWAFCHEAKVTHNHPFWHRGRMDATYKKGLADSQADHQTFLQRKKLWE